MSEHLEMSGESSLDKNFQIRTNNEGENELYIPCWEEEGSNSTQYHHLIEETKFFKNKCKHLENHLEENHREFSSLNQLYLIAETNERRLLKDTEDLKRQHREIIAELSEARIARDANAAELYASAKRESELREKFFKSREREAELLGEAEGLRAECEVLRRKSVQQGSASGAEEEKWKRYYNEQVAKNEQQWKAAYEELEAEFDRKSREVREKGEEIKALTKGCNAHREDYELRIRGLEGELEEARRQLAKSKGQVGDCERQIKELKLVRDDVSAKNDEIEAENSRLKRAVKEEAVKSQKMAAEHAQLQQVLEELNNRCLLLTTEANNSKNALTELRLKLTNQESQLAEARSERDRVTIAKNYAQNSLSSLQEQFAGYRREKEGEISSLRVLYEAKLKELKEISSNEKSGLEASVLALKQQIESIRSDRRESSKLEASMERIAQLEGEVSALKDEAASWRGKFDRLNAKHREEQQSLPCHHEEQISDLRKRMGEQKQEFRANSARSGKLIEDLNAQLEKLRVKAEEVEEENERLAREKKKLIEERERLLGEKNRLANEIEALSSEKNDLINERRQFLSEKRPRGDAQGEESQRSKGLQQKLREKSSQLQKIALKMKLLQEEAESYRSRAKEQPKESERSEREKLKRLEAKLKQKEREMRELEERLEELESEQEAERGKYKNIEKENRSKENELSKKERKIKELDTSIEQLRSQLEQLERATNKDKSTIQALKKQLKSQQASNEKLRIQIERQDSEKQNWESQEKSISNASKLYERQRRQWQQQYKRFTSEAKTKDEQVSQLRRQLLQLREAKPPEPLKADSEIDQLRAKVQGLELQVREKEEAIKRLQSSQRRDEEIPCGTLEQLQGEYNRELQALKRLIMYKGYKEDEGKRVEELRGEYENKLQVMLADYKSMYQEMMALREKVVSQGVAVGPPVDVGAVEEVWRAKVEQLAEEREVLIERVAMWERKYEELRYLFEAKIESKEEAINLLNLKLSNLEMSRPACQYSCHHR